MTPKEKAKQLIQNYRAINFTTGNNSKMIASYEDCKQCALITVNEILKRNQPVQGHFWSYWEQVKEEIEKL